MEENKKKTWKQKLSDNAGDIAFWGTMAVAVVGYMGIVGYAIKKQGDLFESEAERDHELAKVRASLRSDALARGAKVLPRGDDLDWIIEKDGTTSVI